MSNDIMGNPWDAYLNNLDEKGEARTRTDDSYRNLFYNIIRVLTHQLVKHLLRIFCLTNKMVQVSLSQICESRENALLLLTHDRFFLP